MKETAQETIFKVKRNDNEEIIIGFKKSYKVKQNIEEQEGIILKKVSSKKEYPTADVSISEYVIDATSGKTVPVHNSQSFYQISKN